MTVIKLTHMKLLSDTHSSLSCCCPTLYSSVVLCHTKLQFPLQAFKLLLIRAAPPHTELLSWASAGPSSPYTGSCGGTGSGCGPDGGPCRSTALLPSSAPGSGSGCCCCCSGRSSPPLSCSGPPPSPPYRPPASSPRLPEESSRSAGRPAWPSPQRAAQRRGEAERLRA